MTALVLKAKKRRQGEGEEHARQGRVADTFVPMVKADLKTGLQTFRDNVSGGKMEQAFQTGKMDAIMKSVPWERLPKDLGKGFAKVQKAGRQSAVVATQDIPGATGATTQLVLDRTGPALTSFSVTRKGQITQASQDGTHEAVRREVFLARQQKLTPSQLADNVRSVIGLNAQQAVAVINYRAGLGQEIRDPESGKLLRKAVPVRERERMVQDQIDRMLDVRADNIARTELRFAMNAAQTESWQAAQEAGLLPEGTGRKWIVDGNPCEQLCVPMNGIVVGIDEPWRLPDGRDVMEPTESHPNCMCVSGLVFS